MTSLLIVDDDRRLLQLLENFLRESGHTDINIASSASEARSFLALQKVDVIVLDIMMAGEDGISLTKSLRENGQHDIGILLLTARDSLDDRVVGLESGADDYLTKPFEPRELLARINAIVRRKEKVIKKQILLNLGEYTFNTEEGKLYHMDKMVFLTSSELILLKTLAQAPNKPFTRDELAQKIGHRVSERSVDVQIVRLRRKIGDDPRQPKYLQTVRHIGYGLYTNQNSGQNKNH